MARAEAAAKSLGSRALARSLAHSIPTKFRSPGAMTEITPADAISERTSRRNKTYVHSTRICNVLLKRVKLLFESKFFIFLKL